MDGERRLITVWMENETLQIAFGINKKVLITIKIDDKTQVIVIWMDEGTILITIMMDGDTVLIIIWMVTETVLITIRGDDEALLITIWMDDETVLITIRINDEAVYMDDVIVLISIRNPSCIIFLFLTIKTKWIDLNCFLINNNK